jgi:signal transduction histidine kinase
VSDRGPGIDPGVSSRLFERFYTGDSARGTGLGLAIARELALRMNGSLSVSSGSEGTRFRLLLPSAAETRA